MPKRFFQRIALKPEQLKKQRVLGFLNSWAHRPGFWHFTRRSISKAALIGGFMAFLPAIGQMPLAALIAYYAKANLPITITCVCITNPLTAVPIFYTAYKVGMTLMGTSLPNTVSEPGLPWLWQQLISNWQPFLLGCLVCGLFTGLLLQWLVNLSWRISIKRRWRNRININ